MIGTAIVLTALAAALACMTSALHFALREFSVRKLELLSKGNGHETGVTEARVRAITEDPDAHALSLGAFRAIANVALVIGVLEVFSTPMTGAAGEVAGRVWSVSGMVGAGVTAVVLLYTCALVGPLALASHAGERLIVSYAWLIRVLHVMATPFRALHFLEAGVKRLAGGEDVPEKEQLEEELLDVVTESEREGGLDEEQKEMIESVVEMSSVTTEEIMTPRVEVEGLELTDDIRAIRDFLEKAGHSRIPVYEGDLDHIAGVLYAKDLLQFLGEDTKKFRLRPMLRQAIFVPENKPVKELLIQLRVEKVHLAVVLDEFGGTAGIVTLEDILETIVGDIVDEYEPEQVEQPEVRIEADTGRAEIDARAYIADANEALEPLGIAIPTSDEYDTVGGYVMAVLGHIPVVGESFFAEGFVVRVEEAEPTRVVRITVEAQAPAGAGDGEGEPVPVDDEGMGEMGRKSSELKAQG